jgi:alkylated DNA nucleotide flippase Atl1
MTGAQSHGRQDEDRGRRARATTRHEPATTGGIDDYASRVLDAVDSITPGTVMSYGDVAEFVGQGGPRQVGRIMALWGGGVAWWRVVHADGSLLAGHERAALAAYEAEATPLRHLPGGGPPRIDMARARRRG